MARRRQPSKVDQLPPELREAVEGLWLSGRYTLEQLAGFLGALATGRRTMLPAELDLAVTIAPDAAPSKSGLGRHVKGLEAIAEKLQRSRTVAEALVDKVGKEPESRTARLNIELMHASIQDLFMAAEAAGDAGAEGAPVALDPENAMFLARALKDLASARKADIDLTLKLRAEIAKEMQAKAVAAAEKALKDGTGPAIDRVALLKRIREEVYGIVA